MSSPRKSPLISKVEGLPLYVQLELMERMSYKTLKNLCSSSQYFADLCRHEYVKKILQRKYEEKSKKPKLFFYVASIDSSSILEKDKRKLAIIDSGKNAKIFKDNLDHIEKIYVSGKHFFVITKRKIPNLTIKPLKYRGEEYVKRIPDKYYDSSMKGVYDVSGNWYTLENSLDSEEFPIRKLSAYYPKDKVKMDDGLATFALKNRITKAEFSRIVR